MGSKTSHVSYITRALAAQTLETVLFSYGFCSWNDLAVSLTSETCQNLLGIHQQTFQSEWVCVYFLDDPWNAYRPIVASELYIPWSTLRDASDCFFSEHIKFDENVFFSLGGHDYRQKHCLSLWNCFTELKRRGKWTLISTSVFVFWLGGLQHSHVPSWRRWEFETRAAICCSYV